MPEPLSGLPSPEVSPSDTAAEAEGAGEAGAPWAAGNSRACADENTAEDERNCNELKNNSVRFHNNTSIKYVFCREEMKSNVSIGDTAVSPRVSHPFLSVFFVKIVPMKEKIVKQLSQLKS